MYIYIYVHDCSKGASDFFRLFLVGPDVRGFPWKNPAGDV